MNDAEIRQYVDAEKALERIRGNAKLFKMLLTTFIESTGPQFEQLKKEIEADDREAAAKTVHAIKGVAANLSMTTLYELSPSFEALLKGDGDTAETFAAFQAAFDKTTEAVQALLQQS